MATFIKNYDEQTDDVINMSERAEKFIADLTGGELHETDGGDNGIDVVLPDGRNVDVKCTSDAPNKSRMLVQAEREKDYYETDVYVQLFEKETEDGYEYRGGWLPKSELFDGQPRYEPRNVLNYVAYDYELRKLEALERGGR